MIVQAPYRQRSNRLYNRQVKIQEENIMAAITSPIKAFQNYRTKMKVLQIPTLPRPPLAQMLAWTAGIAVLIGTTSVRAQSYPTLMAQSATIEASSAQEDTLYLNEDRNYSYNLEVERGITVNGQRTLSSGWNGYPGPLRACWR